MHAHTTDPFNFKQALRAFAGALTVQESMTLRKNCFNNLVLYALPYENVYVSSYHNKASYSYMVINRSAFIVKSS